MKIMVTEQQLRVLNKFLITEGNIDFTKPYIVVTPAKLGETYVRIKGFITFSVASSEMATNAVTAAINTILADLKNKGYSTKGLSFLNIYGGASNYLNGAMKADKIMTDVEGFFSSTSFKFAENNLPSYPGEANRAKNLEYAQARCAVLKNALIKNFPPTAAAVIREPTSFVMDTGGVVDSKRDLTKYPVPGQMAMFVAKVDIQPLTSITTYNEIGPNNIMTGSYYCNGKNSLGIVAEEDTYVEQCKNQGGLPIKDGKFMSGFEIKWAADVVGNPKVIPIMRWNIFWKESINRVNGKETKSYSPFKVTRVMYKNEWSSMAKIPEGTTTINDPSLKYFMGLKENDPNGGTAWKKFLAPPYGVAK
jgi:hypothetical protein